MLSTSQKLALFRKASDNPGAAFLDALSILQSDMDKKMETMMKEHKMEIEMIKARLPERALLDHIDSLRGDDGEDAEADEVAEALLEMPEFIALTKAEDGHTPTKGELLDLIQPLIPVIRQPEDGHTPTRKELLGLIEPLIPVVKDGHTPTKDELLAIITPLIKKLKPEVSDTPDQIADKLNTLEQKVQRKVIIGLDDELRGIRSSIRTSGGKKGGGMGDVQHESKAVSSATTSISTTYKIAGNGYAVWAYYQGQLIVRGTHYTVNGDHQTLPLTFTPQDATTIDLIYIR